MKKKVLLLNLPNPEQITRKYMSSYVSPESLMPPLELISCAAVCREWHGADVRLIDAIADKLSLQRTIAAIKEYEPDVILSITSFEGYQDDIDTVRELKNVFAKGAFVLFGHYATQFPSETLIHSGADYVILGEPEFVLNEFLKTIYNNQPLTSVLGIAYRDNGSTYIQGEAVRIKDPNELPVPAYDLLPLGKYYEPLLPRPYGMIQTVRGCPYQCNFCVKSYGSKLSQLSTDRIIQEIKLWIELHGVKSIRFIDDTFTLNRRRVIEICKAMISNNINIQWACLSRVDNLDMELLSWMKKAGCKRIYFGMESGSQHMLDIYNKNVTVASALEALHLCRKAGIETAVFFMTGHPEETERDFEETLAFAKAANPHYVSFNPLKPYPGTLMFEQIKHQINFSVYPYRNEWRDIEVQKNFDRRRQMFYRGFYLSPSYFANNISTMIKNTDQIFSMGFKLLRYLWWDKQFIIGGKKSVIEK